MIPFWSAFIAEMAERASGPMWLRLFLQPAVAAFVAIRSGMRDSREGRPPYFWAMLSDPPHRMELLREGWKVLGKVFLLVIALDIGYQLLVDGTVVLRHSLILAVVLAILPYLVTSPHRVIQAEFYWAMAAAPAPEPICDLALGGVSGAGGW